LVSGYQLLLGGHFVSRADRRCRSFRPRRSMALRVG